MHGMSPRFQRPESGEQPEQLQPTEQGQRLHPGRIHEAALNIAGDRAGSVAPPSVVLSV